VPGVPNDPSDVSAAAADWYPDPTGRFELRYFNGRTWTADVSSGGTRLVDAGGTGPGGPTPRRNGFAVAAMVLGIVGAGIAWLPFVFVVGVAAAVLGVVFGVIGLRRSTSTGSGRGFAVAGIATGAAGIVVGIVGYFFTTAVLDAFDAYNNPEPHRVSIDRCDLADGVVEVAVTIVNEGDEPTDFTIVVAVVRAGTDNVQRVITEQARDVAPGASASVDGIVRTELDAVECRLDEVRGPLPFGVQP
jgi:hypothetical protein